MSGPGLLASAGRWSGRGVRVVLGLTVTGLALLLAWAVLMNVLVRDIPEPSSVAEDLVLEIALESGLAGEEALATAEQAVAALDDTLLDGSIDTADDVRLGLQALPYLAGTLILVIIAFTPGARRKARWTGWTLAVTGGALLLLAAIVRGGALSAAGVAPDRVEATAGSFVGDVLAPAWPVGWIALGVGAALWITALRRPGGEATAG